MGDKNTLFMCLHIQNEEQNYFRLVQKINLGQMDGFSCRDDSV